MVDEPMSVKEQLDFAEKNLDHLLEWIGRFDSKSSFIFGINTAMLGVLAALAPPRNLWNSLMIVFALVSVTLLSINFLFVYLGRYPQLKGPSESLLYFGSISKKGVKQYEQEFFKRSIEEHLKDMLKQCHRNAEILSLKFRYLKGAYLLLLSTVGPWAITIYLFTSIPAAQ